MPASHFLKNQGMRQHVMTKTLAYSALPPETKELYNFLMPANQF
jgi:hypothetical protein